MQILIINGPNLNLTGVRESHIYGKETMDSVLERIEKRFDNNVKIEYYQSNSEGEIIDRIQQQDFDALIINPGAYTHYSYAISDCLKSLNVYKVEVHISNLYKREEFRHKSVTAPNVNGLISGLGINGYLLAVEQAIYALDIANL